LSNAPDIETFIKNNNNVAGKTVNIGNGKIDLWMKDCPKDIGNEANNQSEYFYISEDIWVRNNEDDSLKHQNPIGRQFNTVYYNR
jgi:hypothetical protein